MPRNRALSPQARSVLLALASSGDSWSHGYDLARLAGVRSGTLYPILLRLESRGLLTAEWQPSTSPGRPPRHVYRLTAAGQQIISELSTDAPVRLAWTPSQ